MDPVTYLTFVMFGGIFAGLAGGVVLVRVLRGG